MWKAHLLMNGVRRKMEEMGSNLSNLTPHPPFLRRKGECETPLSS
jgi:hypothetical protein